MADDATLVVNGREYPMPETFTLGELADMEKITGQDYDLAKGGVTGTLALAFVAIKRVDDTVTLADLRALGPDDIQITGGDADVPPPVGSASGNADASSGNALSSTESSRLGSGGSAETLASTGSAS